MPITKILSLSVVSICIAVCQAQPFLTGLNLLPLGNIRTSDAGGPYNVSLLQVQVNEVKAAIAARGPATDKDVVNFALNQECFEGRFDTYGAFGRDFLGDLAGGGPTPLGVKKANLSTTGQALAEEVALIEQGHVTFLRHAGASLPCPLTDITGGFNKFLAQAYGLTPTATAIQEKFGSAFDPFQNDETFFLSVLTLEELGATGAKGLVGVISNPVIATGFAGLAAAANAQAAVERAFLIARATNIVPPFGETVQQVFARISAVRDSLDGPQLDDQGLFNTDPRAIAVPASYVNFVPTDIQGITFGRTPQQLINIETLGSSDGTGGFFPSGYVGAINKPTGYASQDTGLGGFPAAGTGVATQGSIEQAGTILPPITSAGPTLVDGQLGETQAVGGPEETDSYTSRGYSNAPAQNPYNGPTPPTSVGQQLLGR
ncbi:hypothetical protein WJX74_004488 [Apatococcus lobatus]|uniref:Uncharacterized protein n=1 Tax=Apatococcus lobatus TaxID=904363 RepID=A0AAW1S1W7_9CHLO